jgi:response regulator NasT
MKNIQFAASPSKSKPSTGFISLLPTASAAKPQTLSILIADDEKRMFDLLFKSCELLGHRVTGIAHNGLDAITLAHELHPDLIILDVGMPEIDGIEAAAAILKQRQVPIIISTGASDEHTLNRVRNLGIVGYLVKPFSPAQLKAAIHMAVSPVGN